MMPEFVFDCKLWAACRVTAATEAEARKKMLEVVDCIDIGYEESGVKLTEASVEDSGNDSELVEVDGEAV